jgi:hypothetical protein
MTKSGVSYQVEVIAEGVDADVDLYLGRSSRPYSNGEWRSSTRSYPLMDGVVFKSTQDGMMYVDVRGITTGGSRRRRRIRCHSGRRGVCCSHRNSGSRRGGRGGSRCFRF